MKQSIGSNKSVSISVKNLSSFVPFLSSPSLSWTTLMPLSVQTSETTRSQTTRNWTSYGSIGKRPQRYLHQDVVFSERCDGSYCEGNCWRVPHDPLSPRCLGDLRRRRERQAIDVGWDWSKSLDSSSVYLPVESDHSWYESQKGRNVNGTATHRAIGQALSANIYRMMTSREFPLISLAFFVSTY